MKRITDSIKKVWGRFDDSLINPPKQTDAKKNFKGENIIKRKLSDGGPRPTPEMMSMRNKILDDQQIQMQTRKLRWTHFAYGMAFLSWYVGATLFIMYRMKGDDLDQLQKQVQARQQRKRDLGV